ncbi:MAG TPA: enoyl-CoA hydratase-related protein, partial [Burkholderiales bacterium]
MPATVTALQASEEAILLRHDAGGIATLTLNRPKQYNCLSEELLAQLQTALDAIAADATVRVVVIAGAGSAFCAGHDLKQMRANPRKAYYDKLFAQCSDVMMKVLQLPQPVIARVHGIATAAGCQLVAQCDLAVASDAARFAVSGINVGLFCSTPSVALGRNVSRKQSMEMLLTGDFIDAASAKE